MKSTDKATRRTLRSVNILLLVLFVLLGTNIQPAYGAQEIVLDHIDGIILGADTVYAERPVRFTFRMNNTPGTGDCITAFTNGFRVYEKSGNPFWPITFDTISVTPPPGQVFVMGAFS